MRFILSLFLVVALATIVNGQSLLIFGGKDHDVFLGCLNCDKYQDKSIWNAYGAFGSKCNDKCIWNKYGNYGGKYSDYSPFNQYASHPPVLVDKDGNFYGYFTTNKFFPKRTTSKLALLIVDFWEAIAEDVSGYYEKIFKR
ncbi:hypothetical protein [Chitinophaga cymbidii]|uniref:Uncharacterized protein n=1 Tax=Chitinophaga cymbidii TaxID=1096750 RepID=A0A512RJ86_9BACT|nr:hypothetical protein [Chitinophaga cymbidii]GEP95776.1 hypothetical protein CCY01nite_20360 [Chitinophaga cymbidii]